MKKRKVINILLIIFLVIVSSSLTSYATSNIIFDSSNVCYSVDSNTTASVQDTIDDLYGRASDYSSLSSRLTSLEGYFDQNSNWLNINDNNIGPGIRLKSNNVSRGSFYYNANNDITYLSANSNGTSGMGSLNIIGNPVEINGVDVASIPVVKCSNTTVTTDVNGVADITYPSGTTLLTAWSNWRYGIFRQGSTVRVYNAIGDNPTLVKNTELIINYCYITTWQ